MQLELSVAPAAMRATSSNRAALVSTSVNRSRLFAALVAAAVLGGVPTGAPYANAPVLQYVGSRLGNLSVACADFRRDPMYARTGLKVGSIDGVYVNEHANDQDIREPFGCPLGLFLEVPPILGRIGGIRCQGVRKYDLVLVFRNGCFAHFLIVLNPALLKFVNMFRFIGGDDVSKEQQIQCRNVTSIFQFVFNRDFDLQSAKRYATLFQRRVPYSHPGAVTGFELPSGEPKLLKNVGVSPEKKVHLDNPKRGQGTGKYSKHFSIVGHPLTRQDINGFLLAGILACLYGVTLFGLEIVDRVGRAYGQQEDKRQ
jgi:hypothetical protein